MSHSRRTLAAVTAALVLTGAIAVGAAADSPSLAPPVGVSFAVIQKPSGVWIARAVIAEPPPPPPASTEGLYVRVFEARGPTRREAVRGLLAKLAAPLTPARAVDLLGRAIAERDLR